MAVRKKEKLTTELLVEKRDKQSKVVTEIGKSIENLQNILSEQSQNLHVNQGALLQLNNLLEDVGYEESPQSEGPGTQDDSASDAEEKETTPDE